MDRDPRWDQVTDPFAVMPETWADWLDTIGSTHRPPQHRDAARASLDMALLTTDLQHRILMAEIDRQQRAQEAEAGDRRAAAMERQARGLTWATGVLAVATVVLAVATVALLFRSA